MRRFRFIGDPTRYDWNIELINGVDYDGRIELNGFMSLSDTIDGIKEQDSEDSVLNDWIEIFNNPLHKDTDLGYYAGLAMQGLLIGPYVGGNLIKDAVDTAKELIKQLNEETK